MGEGKRRRQHGGPQLHATRKATAKIDPGEIAEINEAIGYLMKGLEVSRQPLSFPHFPPQERAKSMFDIARSLDILIDAFDRGFANSDRENYMQLACAKGCNSCCYLQVVVSPAEVLKVFVYLLNERPSEFNAMSAKIKNFASQFEGLSELDRLSHKSPCPFLDESGACSIYEARPIACRTYHRFDRSLCEEAREAAIRKLPFNKPVKGYNRTSVVGKAAGVLLSDITRKNGLRNDPVEFITGLATLIEDPAGIIRWGASGEPLIAVLPR